MDGVVTPFGVTVTDNTPGNYILGTQVLDIECSPSNDNGVTSVQQSGEQWLTIGTGGVAGPWMLTVKVSPSDAAAALLPTPPPTATPLPPTPLPTPLSLPLSFSGSGDQSIDSARPFSTGVFWQLRASCQGDPTVVADVIIYQYGLPGAISPSDGIQVGILEFPCNGTVADTNQHHPNGFPPGTFALDVGSNGNWTITVLAE